MTRDQAAACSPAPRQLPRPGRQAAGKTEGRSTVKTNKDGRPCPDWCRAEHAAGDLSCRGTITPVAGAGPGTAMGAWPRLSDIRSAPEAAVLAGNPAGIGFARADSKREAADLAALLKAAASAPPGIGPRPGWAGPRGRQRGVA